MPKLPKSKIIISVPISAELEVLKSEADEYTEECFYLNLDLSNGTWMTKYFKGKNSRQRAIAYYRKIRKEMNENRTTIYHFENCGFEWA